MKYSASLIALFSFFYVNGYSQQDFRLPGIVVEQNSKYRTGKVVYLSNAEIKSVGATPQRSDSEGKFTLVFSDRPGGDVARIFAKKKDYEVVNEEELKQASVIGRLQPLKIVMCISGQLYENQIAYYNIAKDASLNAYKSRVATLQNEGKEKERLLAELRVQFKQDIKTKEEAIALLDKQLFSAEQQAKELADKWVTVNLDDESPAYQRAFAAFEAKNIEMAKAILDSVDLENRLALNRSEIQKEESLVDTLRKNIDLRREEIRQDVKMCLFKARLHKLDFEWAKAEHYYDLAAQFDMNNRETIFEVAYFLQSQNKYVKALKFYDALLETSRQLAEKNPEIYLPDIAIILNNLGILFRKNNDVINAKKAYEETLEIYRELAEKNPEIYLPDIAVILNNLGILFRINNDISDAKKTLGEALKIRRELIMKNPDLYLPDVAVTLINLGNVLFDNNDNIDAKKTYEEALLILRQLAEKNPELYLPDVAGTLNNLGVLLRENNDIKNAKKVGEEALKIIRQLAKENPDAHLPLLAQSLTNLGELLRENLETSNARKVLEEALQIFRELARKYPEVYLSDVALTLINLGNVLLDNSDRDAAKEVYEEALKLFQQLANKNSEVFLPFVAMSHNNLGALFRESNNIDKAKKANGEALKLYRQLSNKNPSAYLPYVANSLNNLGSIHKKSKDLSKAKMAYEEALILYRQLAKSNPNTYYLKIVGTNIEIALIYEYILKNGDDISSLSAGLDLIMDAIKKIDFYPEDNPKVQFFLPYIHRLLKFFDNFDKSEFYIIQKLKLLDLLKERILAEENLTLKILYQEEIIGKLIEIEKSVPNDKRIKNLIASNYDALAWYQLLDKLYPAAELSARLGLGKDPGEEWINTNLALALLYQGKWDAAYKIYASMKDIKYGDSTYRDTFLEDLETMEKEGITHPDVIKARKLLSNR